MANKYITIDEGEDGLDRNFKAIRMIPRIKPSKNIRETVGGDYDVSYGQVYESFVFTLRVPYEGDGEYGSYHELLTMIRRNNPNGTPGTTFTFTDHYGVVHTGARFSADTVDVEPLTTIIDGSSNAASYLVPVTILLAPGDTITSGEASP
jgi:hypothetical protein